MENGRADANAASRNQQHRIGGRKAKQDKPDQHADRRDGKRIGQGAAIRIMADQRLQDRGRHLKHHGHGTNLRKGQRIGFAQHGIDGEHERLQRVIHQVARRYGKQHRINSVVGDPVFNCNHEFRFLT